MANEKQFIVFARRLAVLTRAGVVKRDSWVCWDSQGANATDMAAEMDETAKNTLCSFLERQGVKYKVYQAVT